MRKHPKDLVKRNFRFDMDHLPHSQFSDPYRELAHLRSAEVNIFNYNDAYLNPAKVEFSSIRELLNLGKVEM